MASFSVSIALATYNGARFINEQLTDIAGQSVLPSELVICDDGSTDGTLAILERFAASAPFAVHIHRNPERLGYRKNFLKCASLCRSDLIGFCDQDDRWLPGKIEALQECFADPDVLLSFHLAEIFAEDGRAIGITSTPRPIGTTPPLGGSPWTFALGFTQMFRRWLCDCDGWWALSQDHDSAAEPMAHDQWYFFLASSLGSIVHIDTLLARYRQHDGNVFGNRGVPQTLVERGVGRIRTADSSTRWRTTAATQRAHILELAAGALKPPFSERAAQGAAAYRILAAQSGLRAAIYAGATVRERARSFAALVNAGGYGSDPWRFAAAALAMDALVGLPGFPRGQSTDRSGETGVAES